MLADNRFLLKSESRADTGHETVHAIRSALAARGKNVDMYAVAIRAFQSPYGYFAEVLRAEGVALPLSFMCSSL
jgi:hypothetical protein